MDFQARAIRANEIPSIKVEDLIETRVGETREAEQSPEPINSNDQSRFPKQTPKTLIAPES
jgi:hypothetical protein